MTYEELKKDLISKGVKLITKSRLENDKKLVGKWVKHTFEFKDKKFIMAGLETKYGTFAIVDMIKDSEGYNANLYCIVEGKTIPLWQVESYTKIKQFKTITQVRVIDAIKEEQLEDKINDFIKDKKLVDIKPLVSGGSEYIYLAAMIIYKTEVEVDEN